MSAPRTPARYRLALLAWPQAVRRESGDDMLATLADGDGARGHRSTREALSLAAAGLRVRLRHDGAEFALGLGGVLVLAAVLAPARTWLNSTVVFADGTRAFGGQGQAWPIREALLFLTPLAIGRLRGATVAVMAVAPFAAWLANGLLSQGAIGYPVSVRQLPEIAAVGAVAAVAAAVLVRACRRIDPVRRRRAVAAVVAGFALVGFPGSLDRYDLDDSGVRYADSWAHDVGFAPVLCGLGVVLLLVALLAPRRRLAPVTSTSRR